MAPFGLNLIKLPVGAVLKNAKVTKTGTEIAEYVVNGTPWKQVIFGSGNKAAQKLALRGMKTNLATGQRTIGFEASKVLDEWGLPLRTSMTATPEKLRPLLFRLNINAQLGETQEQIVRYADKLSKYHFG